MTDPLCWKAWKSAHCHKWHQLPEEMVPNSFCLVRDPISRVLSELRYQLTGPNYSNVKCTCESIIEVLNSTLRESKKNPFLHDCHWVPQYAFVSKCEHVFMFEDLPKLMQCYQKQVHRMPGVVRRRPACELLSEDGAHKCPEVIPFINELPGIQADLAIHGSLL